MRPRSFRGISWGEKQQTDLTMKKGNDTITILKFIVHRSFWIIFMETKLYFYTKCFYLHFMKVCVNIRTVTWHCTHAVSHLDQVTWKRMDQDHFIAIGDVKWVQDEALFVDHRTNQLADLTSSDLIFDPVRPDHSGVYECQISAKQKYSRYVTLRVIGKTCVRFSCKRQSILKT